jgi:hypothetical protein
MAGREWKYGVTGVLEDSMAKNIAVDAIQADSVAGPLNARSKNRY